MMTPPSDKNVGSISINMIVTKGADIGRKVSMKIGPLTTLNQLNKFLGNRFGSRDITLLVDEYHDQSLCRRALSVNGSNPVLHTIFPAFTIPISVTEYGREISLRLNGANGSIAIVKLHETDSVHVLKSIIE